MLDELLRSLGQAIPGTRAALLVDAQGMVVAGGGEVGSPWDLIGAVTADLVRRSAAAHREAGMAPAEASLLEVHDAFTIGEIVTTEALGLAEEARRTGCNRPPRPFAGGSHSSRS